MIGALAASWLGTVPTAVAAPAASVVPVAAVEPSNDPGSRFTLAVLPDTQFYSRYATAEAGNQFMNRFGSEPFDAQTSWLAAHAGDLKIPFVTQLGDIVDQVDKPQQWAVADKAMRTLEDAHLPYSILAGNHDVLNSADDFYDNQYDLAAEPYLKTFTPARAALQSTFGGRDATGMNEYHLFSAEGQTFMVLALSWRASDATLAWASQVLAAHPTVPAILTTHQIIGIDSDGVTPTETDYGLHLWDTLIRSNDQIFLTLNGHFHGASQLTKTNDFGHPVTEIVIDYQMAYQGGNGYLSLIEFDLTHNTLTLQTTSPWVIQKPKDTLTSFDRAFLTGPNEAYTRSLDFRQRFAGFNPDFTAGPATTPSLSQKARDLILADFTDPVPPVTAAPGSTGDYPEVSGTLAHWRFTDGSGVVGADQVVTDTVGGNDLTRVGLSDSGSPTAQLDDVTLSSDHAYLSSDNASACFANADRNTGRYSYLSTASTAPINNVSLDQGYTIETFLKIDKSWTADKNQWMMALIRSGNRNDMPGVPYDRWGNGGPAVLGLSNLKEIQWSVIPADPSLGDRVNWSGEILPDTWIHVAIVNDPATSDTTLYIDGAPVLRNAIDALGQSFVPNGPWLLGAGMDSNQAGAGWNGCIGETRIVDRVLDPSQWLTARADLTTLAVSSPQGALAWDTAVTSISGTGLPGATARMLGDLSGETVVPDTGQWTISLPAKLAAGTYRASVTQALGTRSSTALAVSFQIAAAPADATATPTATATSDPATGTGSLTADGSARATAGSLASTGVNLALAVPIGATVIILLGAIVAGVAYRRRRSRGQSESRSADA